jgi:hypothetical protein
MNICDYFDIHNPEHLRAYMYEHATWPQGFLPNWEDMDIVFDTNWQLHIANKIAEAYINLVNK